MLARLTSSGLCWVVVTICVALAALQGPASALALDMSARSADEIRRRWSELRPGLTGSPYSTAPSISAPYAAGALRSAFSRDGLNAFNYARYLAGLPDDVVLDDGLTDLAQHGVVARSIAGQLMIVPVRADAGRPDDELYVLNDTGDVLWARLDGTQRLQTVIAELDRA